MKNKPAKKFKKSFKALQKLTHNVKQKNVKWQNVNWDRKLPKVKKKKSETINTSKNKLTYHEAFAKRRGWTPKISQEEEIFSGNPISDKELEDLQSFSFSNLLELDNDDKKEATTEPKTKKKKKTARNTIPPLPVLTDDGWNYPKPPQEEKDGPAMNGKETDEPTPFDQDIALPSSHDQDDPLPDKDIPLPSFLDDSMSAAEKKQMMLHLAYSSKTTKTIAQLWADQQKNIQEKKNLMAGLALNGIRKSVMTKNIAHLIKLMRESSPESEVTIRRYCCLTLAQVFHDQIPGYRMQDEPPTTMLKKESFANFKMEHEFLFCYRMYLKTLEETLLSWKSNSSHLGLKALSVTALFCLGEILVSHPHFNYSINIVQLLIPYLNCKNDKMRAVVCDSLSRVFKVDRRNFLTVEIIRRIYRYAQRMRFNVRGEVLQVFLHLPFKNVKNPDHVQQQDKTATNTLDRQHKLIKKLRAKSRPVTSRTEKKEKRKLAKIREAMLEVQTMKELSQDNTRNSRILDKVFGIYFHVLKRKPNSAILPLALEGLSKYAHLISINFFSDILSVLNGFLIEKKLRKKESLFCICTVFAILSGQGENLTLDPHQIYCKFYSLLLKLYPSEVCDHLKLILNIIDQMLISRRKKISLKKVVAFTKRLSTLLLTLPHQAAIPLLICITTLFKVFNCNKILLETEDAGYSGMFLPDIQDPDHSNSDSEVVWELVLSQRHYHPHTKMLSSAILREPTPSIARQIYKLTRQSTEGLLQQLDASTLKFYPPIPTPSMHLSGKKNPKRKAFRSNLPTLLDPQLQKLVNQALDEDNCEQQPPKKRLRIQGKRVSRNAALDDLVDFYPQVPQNEDQEKMELKIEQNLDQASPPDTEAEEEANFLSYFI